MDNQTSAKATQMIDDALEPIIKNGRDIQRIKLMVCPASQTAEFSSIKTKYGTLRIEPNLYVPKGFSYLIEDPGKIGRGFAWVSRPKLHDHT